MDYRHLTSGTSGLSSRKLSAGAQGGSRQHYNPRNYLDSETGAQSTAAENSSTRTRNSNGSWDSWRTQEGNKPAAVRSDILSLTNSNGHVHSLTNGESTSIHSTMTNGYSSNDKTKTDLFHKDSTKSALHIDEPSYRLLQSTIYDNSRHRNDLLSNHSMASTNSHRATISQPLPFQSVTSPLSTNFHTLGRHTSVESDNSFRNSASVLSSSIEAHDSRPPSASSAQSSGVDAAFGTSTLVAKDDPVKDALAREHFPVTLGAHLNSSSQISNGHFTKTLTPQIIIGKALTRSKSNGYSKGQRSRSSNDRRRSSKRPSSGQSSSSSNSRSSIGQLYLMSIESPPVQGGTTALLSSTPYQAELERLRIDRLRIEEERLLQTNQLEGEKSRPPVQKWYELKSSQFHYEFHKHNDRLRTASDTAPSTFNGVNSSS